ncbi:hypothetical protein ACSQ67_006018 [Phaseolus vulgaris]
MALARSGAALVRGDATVRTPAKREEAPVIGLWRREATLDTGAPKIDVSSKIESLKKEIGEEITRKEGEFTKMVDSLKDDTTQSFIVGFETALEQASSVHPTVDFIELNPCKSIVDGKLVEDS